MTNDGCLGEHRSWWRREVNVSAVRLRAAIARQARVVMPCPGTRAVSGTPPRLRAERLQSQKCSACGRERYACVRDARQHAFIVWLV